MKNNQTLIHNVAGELASLYVNYLAQNNCGTHSHDYYKKNWSAEYKSRVNLMEKDPSLVVKLNGYNDFYKSEINQSDVQPRKFLFQ